MRASARLGTILLVSMTAVLPNCGRFIESNMRDGSRLKPFEPVAFFSNRSSSRPLVEGTIARGSLNDHTRPAPNGGTPAKLPSNPEDPAQRIAFMQQGRDRYEAFCAPCHGRDGYGRGMIVQRGYWQPPSLHIDRLRQASDEHFISVISQGFGRMPAYADKVGSTDGAAIVAYLRALQLSQHTTLAHVPPQEQARLNQAGATQPKEQR